MAKHHSRIYPQTTIIKNLNGRIHYAISQLHRGLALANFQMNELANQLYNS